MPQIPNTASESETGRGPVSLEGVLDRVLYQNEERGYAVVEVSTRDATKVAVKGNLLGARIGEQLRIHGEWETHPRFGRQVRAKAVEVIPPSSADGVRAYLGSGLVKGIGPALAARIVASLGANALDIIEKDARKLGTVPGIGKKKALAISAAIVAQRGLREFVAFLTVHGVSARAAQRIWNHYGSDSLRFVRENPYRLADEVWGFGFRKADEIAGKLGLPPTSIERARAGVIFTLTEASGAGHTCVPAEELLVRAEQLLQAADAPVRDALEKAELDKVVVREIFKDPSVVNQTEGDHYIYLSQLLAAERVAAKQIIRLTSGRMPPPLADINTIDAAAKRANLALDPRQREAVATALNERMLVITGGPGVGKTTITRLVVDLARSQRKIVLLASPTGRAARRLSEATRQEASTLHRLLEFNPHNGRFAKNEQNPLAAHLVIIDESSMIDISLAAHLLRSLAPPTRVVFVGDSNQLPSVGPGNFLQDMIESGRIPVVRLNRVFRQGAASGIVEGAHRILNGEIPEFTNQPTGAGGDFFYIEREDPFESLKTLIHIITERIPQRFHLNPRTDVQVISPMYRGDVGVDRLNKELREKLNPDGEAIGAGDRIYRIGDRVMVTKNDIDRDVFNGDVGFVKELKHAERSIVIDLGGRNVEFTEAQLGDVVPAYAISVHRSQGSEYPAVVIPLATQHFVMLRRPLLYTAVTRAKKLCCIVGSRRALEIAIRDARTEERFSMLKKRLQQLP
ncbi:MAG: ATP-dependent RecD-like DNA helicase [Planctomycetota bacterium]